MPCDTRLKPRQTIQQRAQEVRAAVERVSKALAAGRVRVKVSAQGGIAFQGVTEEERDGVTDACMYRKIMSSGSQLAKVAIERAEMAAGRYVDKVAVAQGLHSHDGGQTWHRGH